MKTLAAFAALAVVTGVPSVDSVSMRVAGPPSSVVSTRDGARLYVGIDRFKGAGGGVWAYARDGAGLRELAHVDVPGGVTSLALTPDGATLVAATRVGLAAIPTQALVAGELRGVDVARDSDAPRTNQVVLSRDGRYAFATNAETGTLGVASVAAPLRYIAHVKLDREPDGLALSPDGATLYVASEVAAGDPLAVAGARDPRLGRASCAINMGWHGVVSAIDARAAVDDPQHAVVGRIAAGCAPARVAVAPDGRSVWVSVRGEGRVLAFDATNLRADPQHAFLGEVAVGSAPVGLAFSADGGTLLVANSAAGGDSDDAGNASLAFIGIATAFSSGVLASAPAGRLAREVLAVPGGDFLVTAYGANALDAVSVRARMSVNR